METLSSDNNTLFCLRLVSSFAAQYSGWAIGDSRALVAISFLQTRHSVYCVSRDLLALSRMCVRWGDHNSSWRARALLPSCGDCHIDPILIGEYKHYYFGGISFPLVCYRVYILVTYVTWNSFFGYARFWCITLEQLVFSIYRDTRLSSYTSLSLHLWK